MVKDMRKNRTKKVGMSLAALALISAMALPVSAAGNTQTGDMNVQTTVKSDYMLTVPSTVVDIPFEQENTELSITVSGNIEKGKTIKVTTEDGSLKLGTSDLLPYTISEKQLVWNDAELDNGGENGVEKTTILTITQESWKAAKAGTYTGTVTFTAEMQ